MGKKMVFMRFSFCFSISFCGIASCHRIRGGFFCKMKGSRELATSSVSPNSYKSSSQISPQGNRVTLRGLGGVYSKLNVRGDGRASLCG